MRTAGAFSGISAVAIALIGSQGTPSAQAADYGIAHN
jgi:hypothetical protein